MGSPPFFDLGEEDPEPLDMTGLQPPPQQGPQPGSDQRKQWIKLALIAPLIAKAGPGALEGFLSGWNKSQQQKQEQQRISGLDAERQRQMQAQEQYRQQTLAGQQQTRQQALLKQYSDAITAASTPDEVQAVRQAYIEQAKGIGMRPGPFETLAMTQTPDRLQQRRIMKTWEKLPAESKQEALQNGWTLKVDGQDVPFDQWSQMVGGIVDPATGKPPVKKEDITDLSKSSLEVQAAAAAARGDTDTYQRLLKVKKEMGAADDRPPDPTLQAIRELTLQQQRALQQSGGLTRAQFSQAQSLANDFQQETKTFWTQRSAYQQVVSSNPAQDSPAGHMALVFAYMKLLDPNSVVRETEYANAQNASAVPDRIRNLYNATINGALLTPRQILDFKRQAEAIYQGAKNGAMQVKSIYDQRATAQGLPPATVTYMLEDPIPPKTRGEQKAAPQPGAGTKTTIGRFEVEVEP